MDEKVCRLCLSNGAKVNIFENLENDVFAMIQRCCPISILLDDGFPQNICKKCLKTLGVCDNFLMKCIESDKQLKESYITMQVGYIKVETIENENYMNDDDYCNDKYEDETLTEEALDITVKTEEIANEKILLDDGFPQNICKKCLKTLGVCDNFLMKCIESDKQLKESYITMQVGYIKVETIENENYMNDDDYCNDKYEDETLTEEALDITVKTEEIANEKLHKEIVDSTNFVCEFCKATFKKKTALKRHLLIHKRTSKLECDVCNKLFNSRASLIYHLKKHEMESKRMQNNDGSFKDPKHKSSICPICGKSVVKIQRHIQRHNTERKFVCPHCSKGFTTREVLTSHVKRHDGNQYICDYCQKVYSEKSTLRQHIISNHMNICKKKFQCDLCSKIYTDKYVLKKHRLIHTQQKTYYSCKYCENKFAYIKSLVNHERQHLIIKQHKCPSCYKSFNWRSSMMTHFKYCHRDIVFSDVCKANRHYGKKNYDLIANKLVKCDVCNKTMRQKSFSNHKFIHYKTKNFKCNICSENFQTPAYLAKHMKKIHPDCKFSCDTCGKSFTREEKLKLHKEIRHSTNFACEFCKATFKKRVVLQRHLLIHKRTSKLECDVCNKLFNSRVSLINHLKKHEMESKRMQNNDGSFKDPKHKSSICPICGKSVVKIQRHIQRHNTERKFVCPHCSKGFTTREVLTSHVKRHDGKQYICDYCQKVYSEKSTLREHIISNHMNIYKKDYQCDLCLKIFTKKHLLKIHRLTHTCEKKYSCKYCGIKLASFKSRLEHERLHLGIKPYKCPCCSKAFTQLSNMKSHFKYNHRDIVLSDVYKPKIQGRKLMIVIPNADL